MSKTETISEICIAAQNSGYNTDNDLVIYTFLQQQ
jgi:hypothetical protein